MRITNSEVKDIPQIFELYRIATDYMKAKNQVHWPMFSEELILTEIQESRQWKLLIDEQVACIWATTLDDPLIWGDRNNEPSVYIHRIATDPDFRGQNLVKKLINWANDYGQKKQLKYIRMDTVGLNNGLISHYENAGFQFLGAEKLESTGGLSAHYKEDKVCLFEKEII